MSLFEDFQFIAQKQQPQQCIPCFDNFNKKNDYSPRKSKQSQLNSKNSIKIGQSSRSKIILSSWNQKSIRSTFGRQTFSHTDLMMSNNNQTLTNNTQLKVRKFTQKDTFQCRNCIQDQQGRCEICKGKKKLNGADKIIKFFQFILDFKLGKIQAYNNQKKSLKRSAPNQHCNIYYSTILDNQREIVCSNDVRLSVSISSNRFFTQSQYNQKQKCLQDIHHGFQCDQCKIDPIIGIRYHCEQCSNFDLCETCFNFKGHQHQMQKFQIRKNQKTLDKINQLIKNTKSNLKSTIQNKCLPIRNSFNSKVYKSSIR